MKPSGARGDGSLGRRAGTGAPSPMHGADRRGPMLLQAAHALVEAERLRCPIQPLSQSMQGLSATEAYEIARLANSMRASTPIGYKLGFTSAAMRAQMGVDQPNFGVLLEGSAVPPGEAIAFSSLIHPLVEPEFTFRMGRDLAGADVSAADAWQAVDGVAPSLEIVDSRYERYQFAAVDNIADNSSAARFVLGPFLRREQAGDLRETRVQLLRDGQPVDSGTGAAAMGDPAVALAWLARELAARGARIRAGDLVMTGGLTRAHEARAGCRFTAAFDGFGTVVAQF